MIFITSVLIIFNKFYFQHSFRMSSNDNNPRKRASSAKASHDKVRPSSGNSNKASNKVDFIENIYGNLLSTKRYSNKNIPSKLGSFGDDKGASKVSEVRNIKAK